MPSRRESYERDGFLLVPGLADARTVASLRRACDELVRAGASLSDDTILSGVHYQVQSASGRSKDGALAAGTFRKIVFPAKGSAAFARWRADPRVAALAQELGVARPRCVVDQLNLKAPRVGTGFPWHQDVAFLPPRTRHAFERHGGVNVVIALDPADARNGGFEVLPGSHHGGLRAFAYDTGGVTEGVFDESARRLLELRPGDGVAFHPLLAHGSGPNPSDDPRRLVALWLVGS